MHTIIDRDIDFYQACLETHKRDLATCQPHKEVGHHMLIRCAHDVHNALRVYRVAMKEFGLYEGTEI